MKGREKRRRKEKKKETKGRSKAYASICNFPFFHLIAPGNSVGNSATGVGEDRTLEKFDAAM